MINGTKTIVTSIYGLQYDEKRSGSGYKSFPLLTETINSLIFPEYNYIIYTNQDTIDKYNMLQIYNQKNVNLKIKELDSKFYTDNVETIRSEKMNQEIIYDRIYSVKKYLEVVINKIQNVIEESKTEGDGSVLWIDAGLFGTSCHDGWRDYMRNYVVYNKTKFLDKIFEKIDEYDFIATKGNGIQINYEVRDRINQIAGNMVKTIPGCLFGGKKSKNIEVLSDYLNIFKNYLNQYHELISEQELLSILTNNKNVKFYEFDDWGDLQKAFLKIMDLYNESKYKLDLCYDYIVNV